MPFARTVPTRPIAAAVFMLLAASIARPAVAAPVWGNYARSPQHTAVAPVPAQDLNYIRWQTPVDLQPPNQSGILLIHYGCPLVTEAGTVIVPVKTGAADGFQVEARNPADGSLIWSQASDYSLPASNQPPTHSWIPPFSPVVTPAGRLYMPGAGGTVWYADNIDGPAAPTFTRVAFYGTANYLPNQAALDADVKISTPLTSDSQGNIFFGFRATAAGNPLGIVHGVARIQPDDSAIWASAATISDSASAAMVMNAAPALSNDEQTLYVATRAAASGRRGWLVALNSTTLAQIAKGRALGPDGSVVNFIDDGTASPMVGPDGRVYMGALETSLGNGGVPNDSRGWLLQYNPNMTPAGPPAAFGWDDTPSLVPRSMVASYTGTSDYLLMIKYNFYGGGVGLIQADGVNKIAIVDPNDTQIDAFTGKTVMKEVMTIAGVTPDPNWTPTLPNAVKEWCINTAVVDTFSKAIFAGSEDGILYRWDMASNSFTQSMVLTAGIGEAYTPTFMGKDGAVYAINNAILFCVSAFDAASVGPLRDDGPTLSLSAARPTPFTDATSISFRLPRGDRARIDIIDITGRLVATVIDRDLPAGEHSARWSGQAADGARASAGVYMARLTAGGKTATRRLVLTR